MIAIDSDPLLTKAEKAQQKQSLYIAYNLNGTLGSHSLATTVSPLSNSFYSNDTVESVVGKLFLICMGLLLLFAMRATQHNNKTISSTI